MTDQLYEERRNIDHSIEAHQSAIREHEQELAYLFRRRAEISIQLTEVEVGDEHEGEAIG